MKSRVGDNDQDLLHRSVVQPSKTGYVGASTFNVVVSVHLQTNNFNSDSFSCSAPLTVFVRRDRSTQLDVLVEV